LDRRKTDKIGGPGIVRSAGKYPLSPPRAPKIGLERMNDGQKCLPREITT